MLLGELLRKYLNTQVGVSDGTHEWDINSAFNLPYPDGIDGLDLEQEITFVQEGDRMLVWILAQFNAEPSYVFSNVPKKPGRPARDKVNVGFTVDREVGAKLGAMGKGAASQLANRLLRQHFGLPDRTYETSTQ